MNGRNAQNVYNSHMWPKYPKAADLKWRTLNAVNKAPGLKLDALFLKGPSGINETTSIPPSVANAEVTINTSFQGSEKSPFSKCGNAVPNTNAPTR